MRVIGEFLVLNKTIVKISSIKSITEESHPRTLRICLDKVELLVEGTIEEVAEVLSESYKVKESSHD